MKRKALAIVLTLVMLVGVLPMGAFAASYTDTEGHWAEKSIDRWTEAKVLEGMGDNTYAPDKHLSRAEAMTIFSRLLKLTEKADISKVTDVEADVWYTPYIETGYAYQIIKGTSDTTFDPLGSITREQFFSIFARAMGIPSAATCDKTFTDMDQISPWAVTEGTVYSMINRGYLDGYPDGSLQPTGKITRAEVAKVLDNAISDYITEDGTYAISGNGIVVVLAKDVKLTGNFNGHIVSSCPDSTLNLSGLSGTPYIYVLGDNTKIVSAKPGTKVAVNPAADNVTANGVKVTNPPYTPEKPYIVPGGGTGGGPSSRTSYKYQVTASVKVPFGKSALEFTPINYTADQKLSKVLTDLANDKVAVKNALQEGFDKITKDKHTTVGDYQINVSPNKSGDDVETFNVTMTKDGAYVDMKEIVKDELDLYQAKMDEKAAAANLTGNPGWDALKAMFTPDVLFDFSDDNTIMTTKTTDVYAGLFADMLTNLAKVYDNLPVDYQYKTEITDAVGSHWDNYDIFGTALANIDAILGGNDVMLQKTLDNNSGVILNVTEDVNSADDFTKAVDNLSGRNYVSSPEIQALIQSAFKVGDDGKTKYNVGGEYILKVDVVDLSK